MTILQSGNVIITSDCGDAAALASLIDQLLAEEFGVNVPRLARTAEQVEEREPLTADERRRDSRHMPGRSRAVFTRPRGEVSTGTNQVVRKVGRGRPT